MFGKELFDLQFRGRGHRDGRDFDTYGIVYVPAAPMNPARDQMKEEATPPAAATANSGSTDSPRGRASTVEYMPLLPRIQFGPRGA